MLKSLAEEEGPPKETEKERPVAWEENQVNVVSQKLGKDIFKQVEGVTCVRCC